MQKLTWSSGTRAQEPPPGAVEHFCFPVGGLVASEDEGGATPGQYTFVRTLDDGARQYGYCRRCPAAGDGSGMMRVLCVLARHAWFKLFYDILDALLDRLTAEVSATALSFSAFRCVSTVLVALPSLPFVR